MKLFVIGGKAKSGKTTFGNYLKEYLKEYGYKPCVMHITEPLYQYARNYFDWDENRSDKPREFLQKMGIDIIQKKMGKKEFLLNRLSEDIEILSNFFDCFIITDTRLVHEFQYFREHYDDVVTIKLQRENFDNKLTSEEKKHITENDLNHYYDFDYVVVNNEINDLEENAKRIVKIEEKKH